MQTTIDIPDTLYRQGEQVAHGQGISLEEFIVQSVSKQIVIEQHARPKAAHYVKLPLIESDQPGTLDLSNFDFDDLLA